MPCIGYPAASVAATGLVAEGIGGSGGGTFRLREINIASAIAAFEIACTNCAGGGFFALCSSIIFFVS